MSRAYREPVGPEPPSWAGSVFWSLVGTDPAFPQALEGDAESSLSAEGCADGQTPQIKEGLSSKSPAAPPPHPRLGARVSFRGLSRVHCADLLCAGLLFPIPPVLSLTRDHVDLNTLPCSCARAFTPSANRRQLRDHLKTITPKCKCLSLIKLLACC